MLCVVSILQGSVRMFERILSADSEMVVFEKNVSDLFFSNVPLDSIEKIRQNPAVERIDAALFGIVSSKDNPIVTCFGVSADSPRIKDAEWIAGNSEQFSDTGQGVVVGKRAADFLNAEVGKMITVGNRDFKVIGIIESSNGFEDGGVFMPLKVSQDYFHKEGMASVATIKLKNKDQAQKLKKIIEDQYPNLVALENEEFSQSYSQFKILKTTAWVVGGIAFILGGLSVANTMILSVFGRIREIAILRVCGFSRGQLARLIFSESILIACFGAIIGTFISFVTLQILKALPSMQGYIDASLDPLLILAALAMSLITGIGGAFYPALYAMKIKPAAALRFE